MYDNDLLQGDVKQQLIRKKRSSTAPSSSSGRQSTTSRASDKDTGVSSSKKTSSTTLYNDNDEDDTKAQKRKSIIGNTSTSTTTTSTTAGTSTTSSSKNSGNGTGSVLGDTRKRATVGGAMTTSAKKPPASSQKSSSSTSGDNQDSDTTFIYLNKPNPSQKRKSSEAENIFQTARSKADEEEEEERQRQKDKKKKARYSVLGAKTQFEKDRDLERDKEIRQQAERLADLDRIKREKDRQEEEERHRLEKERQREAERLERLERLGRVKPNPAMAAPTTTTTSSARLPSLSTPYPASKQQQQQQPQPGRTSSSVFAKNNTQVLQPQRYTTTSASHHEYPQTPNNFDKSNTGFQYNNYQIPTAKAPLFAQTTQQNLSVDFDTDEPQDVVEDNDYDFGAVLPTSPEPFSQEDQDDESDSDLSFDYDEEEHMNGSHSYDVDADVNPQQEYERERQRQRDQEREREQRRQQREYSSNERPSSTGVSSIQRERSLKDHDWVGYALIVVSFIAWIVLLGVMLNFFYSFGSVTYCDTDSMPRFDGNGKIICHRCPDRGICTDGAFSACQDGYVRSRQRCIVDPSRIDALNVVFGNVEQVLREHKGKFECKVTDQFDMPLEQLGKEFGRHYWIKVDAVEKAYTKLIDHIVNRRDAADFGIDEKMLDSIVVSHNDTSGELLLHTVKESIRPLWCQTYFVGKQLMLNNLQILIGLFGAYVLYSYIRIRAQRKKEDALKTEHMFKQLLGIIQQQSRYNPEEPWISEIILQEEVIGTDRSKHTLRLWEHALEKVLSSSNKVLYAPRYVNGESQNTLEWSDTGAFRDATTPSKSATKQAL
ncbi:hypothetical protein SAMD00019534_020860 [Acytostelium subglobosum LB1]|uniref:hypothetical protein n=1 Tax=Acytostelium subglobosum LB1 TaxID=1410327 RepID=UPI000644D0A3|nr:hypothetical protein SAMD00019534_020860 [Acytostelium subglobosum LB1]GAM18911.1 hypothetical protein SAMD00019534_020860 [Acytostelium subglobosum LB1]|eukprot:XP_012758131.1 hypothetical protein SAMD00019534_020860 [Acytostelium subglobosum LB1]